MRAGNRQLRELIADIGMLVKPQAEGILGHAGNEGRGFPRRQPFLGLARKLRILHLDRKHEADLVPDVVRRELDPARQQVAELAKLADSVGDAGAQAVDMRSTL